jgi:hypothetical protein
VIDRFVSAASSTSAFEKRPGIASAALSISTTARLFAPLNDVMRAFCAVTV